MFGDGSLTFVLSTRAEELAGELRTYLHERFHLAVRVRAVAQGIGYRLYQLRKPKNRHLADVRSVEKLPACNRLRKVLILTPRACGCGRRGGGQLETWRVTC
jgi:hypothetical protein